MIRFLFALALCVVASASDAATCFWVGGTGSWSTSNTASWASSSGGTTGTCAATGGVPKQAADTATFDGSSGGGTVTVDSTMNGVTLTTITAGAFTGTLDFSVNNPSMTLTSQLVLSGSGTRTIKLGSGTFTLSGNNGNVVDTTTTTGLTLQASSSTLTVNGAPTQGGSVRQLILGGSTSWGTINISNSGASGVYSILNGSSATIATLNLTAPVSVRFDSNMTITNALNWAGSSLASLIDVFEAAGSSVTITVASGSTIQWGALAGMTFGGAAVTATNSIDLHGNNMNGGSITAPSSGGGRIIGG